jgi:hypothetical protein
MATGRRIDFILAGAQKGGTTTIDGYLRTHPAIEMAAVKEVHFFDREAFIRGGRLRLGGSPCLATIAEIAFSCPQSRTELYDRYHQNWTWMPSRIRGESTPDYLRLPEAIGRMAAYNPGLKVVCAIRNPIDRAWSNWRMTHGNRTEALDFRSALEAEDARIAAGLRRFDYLRRSRYGEQLANLYAHFPREQCHLVRFEDLVTSPASTIRNLFEFLGVSPHTVPDSLHLKTGGMRDVGPPADLIKKIADQLEPDLRMFETLTGWDCRSWRNSSQRPMSRGEERRLRRRAKWRTLRVALGEARRNFLGDTPPLAALGRWSV